MTDSFSPPPRLYYVHPLWMGRLPDWPAHFDRAAAMGFDWILTAPPFDPGPCANLFLTHDPDRLHPALGHDGWAADGLGWLAGEAAKRGLGFAVDLVPGRAAGGGPLAEAPGLSTEESALDPRIDPSERGAVDLSPERVVPLWADRVARMAEAGVSGFRAVGVDRVSPAVWRDLVAAGRRGRPGARFMAWTPGLGFEHRAAIAEVGFDAVFSSLRWWDCRSSWLVDEHEIHRRIAPAIAFPEAPFSLRLAREVEGGEEGRRALGRALWLAASLGDGLLLPMGYEFGARDPMEPTRGSPADVSDLAARAGFDLSEEIAAANRFLRDRGGRFAGAGLHMLTGSAAGVSALVRSDDPDLRHADHARLVLVNPDLRSTARANADVIIPETGGRITRFSDIAGTTEFGATARLTLDPGGVRVLEGHALDPIVGLGEPTAVEDAVRAPRYAIEALSPRIDEEGLPVRRRVGETVTVEADLIGDGHDRLAAAVLWRTADEESWHELRMAPVGNDRWAAEFPLERLGRYWFTVEVWLDRFETYRNEVAKKHAAGLDLSLELEEGRRLVQDTRDLWSGHDGNTAIDAGLDDLIANLTSDDDATRLSLLLSDRTAELMRAADPKRHRTRREPPLPLDAERGGAVFASWYEVFPRSLSDDPERHGTFDDVIRHMPRVRDMGFDVLYFPPIHPIGRTNRKGRNNSLKAGPGDPGSPYAIGSEAGGHDAVHPELGTLDDFRRMVSAAADHGLEIALDFAIQCSPDHPWLKEHPDWFDWRPDGTIRYAENPPKKYEDIVNVDFYADGAIPGLWLALRDVTLFWVEQGIRLFRVDNPHTKPFPFWQWLIADIRARYPDVVFLAEAFTRPKVMNRLAKVGFSQSYTYFTWRNTKHELETYLTELDTTAAREFFRPHFFVNTPDINPVFLQNAPRSAYLIRAALAATLSGLWGVYNGFELCEGRPVPGKEEYLDSEKYEIRAWDWGRAGNIVAEITQLNRIRRDNPALHSHLGVEFLPASNDKVLWYLKATPDRSNALLVAVNLDPHQVQSAWAELPLWMFGVPDHGSLDLEDLVSGARFRLTGKHQQIALDPHVLPYFVWRVAAAREG